MFPPADSADEHGLVAIGADVNPGTLLAAYRSGLFPMPIEPSGLIGWWSPDPRGVLAPNNLVVSRSLERSRRRYEIRIDSNFDGVMDGCADPERPRGWIDDRVIAAYNELHRLGWAHSIEAWDGEGLAGGLYGVAVGGLFAGESMFHRRTDASKVALVALTELYDDREDQLIDVQWCTDHLSRLGATELRRDFYLGLLPRLVAADGPDWIGAQRAEGHGSTKC